MQCISCSLASQRKNVLTALRIVHAIKGGRRNIRERRTSIETLVGNQRLNAGQSVHRVLTSTEQSVVLGRQSIAVELAKRLVEWQLLERIGSKGVQRVRIVKAVIIRREWILRIVCVEKSVVIVVVVVGVEWVVVVGKTVGRLRIVIVEETARNTKTILSER